MRSIPVYTTSRLPIAQRVAGLLSADASLAMTSDIEHQANGRYAVRVALPSGMNTRATLDALLSVDAAVRRVIESCADIRGGGVVKPTPMAPSLLDVSRAFHGNLSIVK